MHILQRAILSAIVTVGTIMVFTILFSFFGIPPTSYTPYMYFFVALVVLSLYLSPEPLSIIA
jgi:hypothetical protein